MKPLYRLAACLTLALWSLAPAAADFAPAQLRDFPRDTLTITHGASVERFQVWLAQTGAQQEQGLMFLTELPAGYGMLFPQTTPRVMTMWMKNTYIGLDMLFIGANGRISHIVHDAVPLSTEIISSGGPIASVLEIRGGESRRLGLREGDRVVQGAGQTASP
jgi:uncharacterized membrane protein (UPF0127 family)